MGLREQKKLRARATIMENAIALFRERGYDATTVRELCARSEISEATFFNYFPSKDALLHGWAHASLANAFADARGSAQGRPLRATLRGIARGLAARVEAERPLMAVAFGRARIEPPTPPEAAIEMVREAQDRGELRADLEAEELARLLHATAASVIAGWLASGSPEPLGPRLSRALDWAVDGSRKRSERIRMAAGARSRPSLSTR